MLKKIEERSKLKARLKYSLTKLIPDSSSSRFDATDLLIDEEELAIELMRLLVYLAKQQQVSSSQSFDCYVIKIEDLGLFIDQKISSMNLLGQGSVRFQVVIKHRSHFNIVDFAISKQKNNVFCWMQPIKTYLC